MGDFRPRRYVVTLPGRDCRPQRTDEGEKKPFMGSRTGVCFIDFGLFSK